MLNYNLQPLFSRGQGNVSGMSKGFDYWWYNNGCSPETKPVIVCANYSMHCRLPAACMWQIASNGNGLISGWLGAVISRLIQSKEWLLSLSVWYLSLESSSVRGKLKIPTISVFYISTRRRTVDLRTLWECLPGTPDTGCLGEELEYNGWMTGFFPWGAEGLGSTTGDDGLCPENCSWAHMWDVG